MALAKGRGRTLTLLTWRWHSSPVAVSAQASVLFSLNLGSRLPLAFLPLRSGDFAHWVRSRPSKPPYLARLVRGDVGTVGGTCCCLLLACLFLPCLPSTSCCYFPGKGKQLFQLRRRRVAMSRCTPSLSQQELEDDASEVNRAIFAAAWHSKSCRKVSLCGRMASVIWN